MRQMDWRVAPLMIMMAAPLVLGGCSSTGGTERSSTEGSSAMAVANQSKAQADKALSTAQQALKEAQEAKNEAQLSTTASNRMYQRSLQK